MSWFIGIKGETTSLLMQYCNSLNIALDNVLKTDKLILIFGGIKENLNYDFDKDGNGWLVSGLGIQKRNENFSFMKKSDWKIFLSSDEFNIKELNGHFCGLIIKNEKTVLFNDQLGVREIYYKKTDSTFLFSSRIDWITKFNKENEINVKGFSTRWLFTHQINFECVVKDTSRLGPGGKIIFENNTFRKLDSSWSPSFDKITASQDFEKILTQIVTLHASENQNLNLGLSGGLDSRVLLVILLKNVMYFNTHTFGNKNIPDGKIAKQITDDLKIDHEFLNQTIGAKSQLLDRLHEFIPLLGLTAPIFDTSHLPLYKGLNLKKNIIIDGAFGEAFRRGFLNKILLKDRNAVYHKDAKKISRFLISRKADIFNEEFETIISKSALSQIHEYINLSPDPNKIGIENWIDAFISKTKIPNICCPGQSLLDNFCTAYMPFIQPSILNSGLNLPLSERKNGVLFKKMIHASKFSLNKYPLVKNQVVYPYFLNNFYSRAYTKIKRKWGFVYNDNSNLKMLDAIKDFVFDTLNSAEVKNFPLYDYGKIKNITNNFYKGNKNLANQLNWWLTFEIWRKGMKIKK